MCILVQRFPKIMSLWEELLSLVRFRLVWVCFHAPTSHRHLAGEASSQLYQPSVAANWLYTLTQELDFQRVLKQQMSSEVNSPRRTEKPNSLNKDICTCPKAMRDDTESTIQPETKTPLCRAMLMSQIMCFLPEAASRWGHLMVRGRIQQ